MPNLPPSDTKLEERLQLIVGSYQRLTGKPLINDPPSNIAALREAVWDTPRAIVAHGTEADPIFFYGNRAALQQFEMSFEEFTCLPSRISAEPIAQAERATLLEKVTRQRFIDDYSGTRITKSGKRFMITGATVWNLLDATGGYHGQAACFIVPN
jgi:hypothetical protein